MKLTYRSLLLPLLFCLQACGGGYSGSSGSSTPPPPVTNPPPPATNQPPVARVAPTMLTVDEGAAIELDGSASSDPEAAALSYAWRRVSGPEPQAAGAADGPQFRYTAPQVSGEQLQVIELRVRDAQGAAAIATTSITIRDLSPPPADLPPTASAGTDTASRGGATVTLDGSGSRDPEDGTALVYAWQQLAGPAVVLRNADTVSASFIAPDGLAASTLVFRLQVQDSAGQSATDEMQVAVTPEPALVAACSALGAPAAPLCDGLRTLTQPLIDGCSGFATPAFCATFGGDLNGLVQGCRIGGDDAEPLCKALDQVLQGVASGCRLTPLPESFCALLGGELVGDSAIAAFEAGPLPQVLRLQRELGVALPLRDAQFLATHNSFNATINNLPPTLSGEDANQRYPIPDQLRMGIRGIELDVHWWFSLQGSAATAGRAPLLCHGNANHLGCTTERTLRAGLVEIRDWLQANPGEVIVIDLEDHLAEAIDDSLLAHDTAAAQLQEVLGAMLYSPQSSGGRCEDGFPVQLSTQQVRTAGKQVVIYTGCGAGALWPQLVWQRQLHAQTSISGLGDAPIAYPDQCIFTPEEFSQRWTRIFEDATLVGVLTGIRRRITAPEVSEMGRCGINMPSLDHATPYDPRIEAFVWSWATAEPVASPLRNCALHNAEGRYVATACTTPRRAACVSSNDALDWQVSGSAVEWTAAVCPAGRQFGVPRSSEQNEQLKAAKAAAGVSEVWLNYSDRATEGNWVAGP
ncbi:MAG TPA: phosphatidylinositol-specific phospholipase C domain-containing protein [Solimonas sp.]|nr:phosphatidylinositol-specific phospholipase C domain-containing protein [Solimonas sp.]